MQMYLKTQEIERKITFSKTGIADTSQGRKDFVLDGRRRMRWDAICERTQQYRPQRFILKSKAKKCYVKQAEKWFNQFNWLRRTTEVKEKEGGWTLRYGLPVILSSNYNGHLLPLQQSIYHTQSTH